jgi:pyruvate/2-oxoglutarate dehydrogenase complex dihydrolipoamide acyltransferase (E2) component
MLWGYTDKDLEGGEDARLVKDLDNEKLIFRVLAYSNLYEITKKGHTYRADLPAAKRLPAVQRFKEDLRLGEIRWSPTAPKPRTAPPAAAPAPPVAPPAAPPEAAPDEDDAADEIKPASATAPLDGTLDAPRVRPAASSAARPKLVFPEPSP